MSLLNRFIEFIKSNQLFYKQDGLLLAVSGGVDSVVLCEICHQAGFQFAIAHCNFQLREEESDRDEQLVRSLGTKYNVEVYVKHFNTAKYAEKNKVSIQIAARELRYNWFFELLDRNIPNSQLLIPNYLLTAHHADDNIETLLMNLFKGTGITGLHGILPKQGRIVRPLLFAYKEEIKAFAAENNLKYVEDSSNSSDKYTRNYFRNQLIPAIEKVFPAVKENLTLNINRFREVELLYQQAIQQHKKKLVEQKGNEYHIPVLKLQKTQPVKTILYEIIKDFNFTPNQVTEVLELMNSESGRYIASSTHRIIKNRAWLIISPNKTEESEHIIIEKNDTEIIYPGGKLELRELPTTHHSLLTTPSPAQLDADQIQFPLVLRKWRPGDYFYPLGMKKKKKLSRFFIDQKLSLTDKENVWVVEMNKKIIWIVGRRIDERFKVDSATKKILLITLQ